MLHAASKNVAIIWELYLTSNAKADLSAAEAWSIASWRTEALLTETHHQRMYIRGRWTQARYQEAVAQQLELGWQQTRRTGGGA